MREDGARDLAREVVIWLATHDELLPVFMNSTGNSADSVRKGAARDDFLAAVLDFLLLDDEWVIAFCDAHRRNYADPAAARQMLPGGTQVHWT